MNPFKKLRHLLRTQSQKDRLDMEMAEEMRSHVQMQTLANIKLGMNSEEARYAALRQFGWTESIKEDCRDQRGVRWLENLVRNLRFAARMLRKNIGFTLVSVLTLALGIGATTALFSVVYGVLISPYPYAKPGEIWAPGLRTVKDSQSMRPYRPDEYFAMSRMSTFSDVMATAPGNLLLTGEYAPESIRGVRLSANAFQFLGVPPLFGRTIQLSDISPTGEPEAVTVLSFKRWQRLFGSDTNVLGRTLRLDDQTYTIIGVMPPRFGWWTSDGLWMPMGVDSRDQRGVFPIARLKKGVAASAAEPQLHALQLELAKINPAGFPKDGFTTSLTNYLDITTASGEMENSLRLLFGAVAFLLLIACANVANLQLAKATSRAREMAIRLSVGAGRTQLMSQLLTESLLISIVGGMLGLLSAFGITRLMVMLMPSFFVPGEARIEVNGFALLFCMAISVLTGILFGLAPALQLSRPNLAHALNDESRGSSSSEGGKTRSLLVVAEVALSMVLLVSACLTIRSFASLQQVELGFQPEHVMTVGLPLSPKRYSTWEKRNRFAKELLERVQNLPGVQAATIGNGGQPFGGLQSAFTIAEHSDAEARQITLNLVGSEHLKTLGIPLIRGRMPTAQEINASENVAAINEAAIKFWPAGIDPIGRSIKIDALANPGQSQVLQPTSNSANVTIVGIFGNTRNDDLRSGTQPSILVPYTLLAPPGRTLVLRTQSDPKLLMNAVRGQVREMDMEQPVNGPTTFNEILGFQTAQSRFTMALFSLFAALGLALAMAGIYSVLSYLVSRRTREIGVRMALGAQQLDVLHLIFGMGGRLVGAGILIGMFASFGAARLLGSQMNLFHVSATDPLSFLGMIVLLSLVAGVACLIPARRATRVDPMVALRSE